MQHLDLLRSLELLILAAEEDHMETVELMVETVDLEL